MLWFLGFPIVGLKADLKDTVAQGVAIEWLDCHQAFIVVGHGDKAKAFTFVGLQIPDDLDILHRAKGAK